MTLVAEDLTIARGGVRLLDKVGFDVPSGQALILQGANGIGKTALLRTVAGLQPMVSGRVICEEDSIAYAAHSDGLKATLTVAENLQFWSDIFGQSSIDAAVAAFDLVDLMDRLGGTLSAGQKRRLGLARLLVTGRSVWVLDEPTVSLDTASIAKFAKVVGAHLANGGTALIATHIDLGLTARTLDLEPFRAVISAETDDFDRDFL